MSTARRRSHALGLPVDFKVIDLRDLKVHVNQTGTFEQIICLETIEHISDDVGLFQTLATMLQPGGQILVTSPYAEHHPQPAEDTNPDPTEDGSHVRYGYTPERLAELLTAAGLVVTEQAFVSGMISQYLTNLMRLMGRVMPARAAWLLVLPLRPLVLLDPRVSGRYPYLSVAAQAVRPSE